LDEDIDVYLNDVLLTSGYSVQRDPDTGTGTIRFDVAPQAGATVTLNPKLKIDRMTDVEQSGPFHARLPDDELDFLTAAPQDVAAEVDRSVRLSPLSREVAGGAA
jgi:hypothetical protein